MRCERRMTLLCVLLHTVCHFLILLIIVVNYTRFMVHLSTELMLNTCRLSDAASLETLMVADRWESSPFYNLPYLLSATWRCKDSRSLSSYRSSDKLNEWQHALCCVLFCSQLNNISKIQFQRFQIPQFTCAQFILCQSLSLKMH